MFQLSSTNCELKSKSNKVLLRKKTNLKIRALERTRKEMKTRNKIDERNNRRKMLKKCDFRQKRKLYQWSKSCCRLLEPGELCGECRRQAWPCRGTSSAGGRARPAATRCARCSSGRGL